MGKGFRAGVVAAVALFLSVASFNHPRPGSNVWSRLGPAINLIDQHTLELGEFGRLTHDKRIVDGREFSDKAPGSIFVAAATYGFFKVAGLAAGLPYDRIRYIVRVAVLGLAAVFIFGLLSRIFERGPDGFPSHVAAAAYVLSAPVFAYHILYFGHELATALVLAGLVLVLRRGRGLSAVFFAGVFFGLAAVVEYPVILLGLWAVLLLLRGGWKKAAVYVASLLFFAVVPVALYNWYCFGSPLSFGYSDVALPYYRERMARGLFGFTYPKLGNLWLLTFSAARGLFFWAPAFLAGVVGLVLGMMKDAGRRGFYAWSLAGFSIYLLVFSAYHEATGGAAFGPRHLLPALPLLAFGWPAFWKRGKVYARTLVLLWIAGVALTVLFVGTEPLLPMRIKNPLVEFYPMIFANRWFIWSAGEAVGLRGFAGLFVPFALFSVVLAGAWAADRGRSSVSELPAAGAISSSLLLAIIALAVIAQLAVVRSDPGDLHYELANYHFIHERFALAETEYLEAARHRRDPYIWYYLAVARLRMGDCGGARDAAMMVRNLGSGDDIQAKLRQLAGWLERCEGREE